MGTTRYFGMAFFDFGDSLDAPLNIDKEVNRFVLIDKQLYGLYSIFGDGVVDGWVVADNGYTSANGISVTITPGLGIINHIASQTSLPGTINNLTPNSLINIYATISGATPRTRVVNFTSTTGEITTSSSIKIASLVTGNSSIVFVDNTVKELISFEELIQEEINQHQHRGTPSKIDLQEEVKNQLPGARIEGIDASKITSGVLGVNSIPLIDHSDLEYNGLLTHAALDSFVRSLSQSNKELLGEISTVNLLKTIIFLKYLYSEVDEHFINELVLIPGISPNEFIDFEASTAYIDLNTQCISGYTAKTGLFSSIYWNDQESFSNYHASSNVVISNGEISLTRDSERIRVIEEFKVGELTGFTSEIVIVDSVTGVVISPADGQPGVFTGTGNLQARHTKDLRTNISENIGEDWGTDFNEFVTWVKTIQPIHEAVYMSIVTYDLSQDKEVVLSPIVLIEKNYVTTNEIVEKNNFEEMVVALSNLDVSNVTKIIIYTDETSSEFSFSLDNMYLRHRDLIAPSGTIRYRYFTESDVVFHSIWYEAVVPDNTEIQVRLKTASTTILLPRASYNLPIRSGDVFAAAGSAIEIEITLLSTDSVSTPVVDYLELRILVDGDFTGFEISTASDWRQGDAENITIEGVSSLEAELTLTSPINVGGYYFAYNDSVSELDDENVGNIGFAGNRMPISANQAADWVANPERKFSFLSSVVRRYNKNYLVADTNNDRVLELDVEGNLVRGFGSCYYSSDNTEIYPLSFVYNQLSHILAIVLTRPVNVLDLTKISFYIGMLKMSLTDQEVVLDTQKCGNRVIEIQLHDDTWTSLANVTNSHIDDITVTIDEGAFDVTLSDTEGKIKTAGNFGWECFVGDFTYIDNISHPIFVDILENDNFIVANSLINYDATEEEGVENTNSAPGIIEFNPDTEEAIFTTDAATFSDFSLGSIYEFQENRFLVPCLEKGEVIAAPLTGQDIIDNATIVTDKIKFRAAAVDALEEYKGKILLIDKVNNTAISTYTSPDNTFPSDIDVYSNGTSLVAESSFADSSGRLIKLDSFGTVIWVYGSGQFNLINDAKIISESDIMISL